LILLFGRSNYSGWKNQKQLIKNQGNRQLIKNKHHEINTIWNSRK
jgi:hypothetical protein